MEDEKGFQKGTLKVSEDVIATVARLAAFEVEGVAELTKAKVTFRQLFLRPGKNGSIQIKLAGDAVQISLGVLVHPGHPVVEMAENVQERVKSDVQTMTGVTVSRVNVEIAGIVFSAPEQ